MRKRTRKWKFCLQALFSVLLIPLVWFIATPILKPWAGQWADRKIAKWEQLQDKGLSLMKARKYDEAQISLRAALSYAEKKLLVVPSRERSSAFALGGVLLLQERFDEARVYFERSLVIGEKVDGEFSPELCIALKRLIEVCLGMSDFDAALDYAQRAVAIRERQELSPNPELVSALGDLARVYERQRNYAMALRIRKRIVKLTEAMQSSNARELGIAYYREALMHNAIGDYGSAEKLYQQSLTTLRGNVEPEAECLVLLVRDYARLLDATGRADEASRLRAANGLSAIP